MQSLPQPWNVHLRVWPAVSDRQCHLSVLLWESEVTETALGLRIAVLGFSVQVILSI